MNAPNMTGVIFSQGSHLVRVRRRTGEYVDGRWVEAFEQDLWLRMAVRPNAQSRQASAYAQAMLGEEGMSTVDAVTVIVPATTPLYFERSGVVGGHAADRILWRGWWRKILGEVEWEQCGFLRYFALREQKWGEP